MRWSLMTAAPPASGPYDVIIENNRIVDVVELDPVALNRVAKRLPVKCMT